jgi:transcription termination/antitermination protein NusG
LCKTPHLSEDGEALSLLVPLEHRDTVHGVINAAASAATAQTAPAWFAAYTAPRHEKAVARHFEVRNVEHFLPLFRAERRWKNGCKVAVEFPVFPSYLFVHTSQRESSRLLDVPGVLAFVGQGRRALAIPDAEMDLLRRELPLRKFEPYPYLTAGCKVRIAAGPLAGACGVLLRKKNNLRVVLSIDLIRQSVAVEVAANEIEPI